MKNIALKIAVVLVVIVGITVGLNRTHAENNIIQKTDEPDGEQIYNQRCARCHGENGKAETNMGKRIGARDLTDKGWQDGTSDDDIFATIKEGSGAMPSFKAKLNDEEIKAVVKKVRKLKQE